MPLVFIYGLLFVGRFFSSFALFAVNKEVGEDTEDQSACYCSKSDLTESKSHTAYTGDEDDGGNEEVSVVAEVNLLDHLQTGYCDEAVEGDAYAAHYAGRNGCEEGYEGSEEGSNDRHNRGSKDSYYGSVTGDGYTTDGFTVGGVGATAEDRTYHGTDAVTEQGVAKSGIFKKVVSDYGGEVGVVCDVFCEYYEGNGNIRNCDGCNVGTEVTACEVVVAAECLDEGEVGVPLHIVELGEVDDFESIAVCDKTDHSEDGCYYVTCKDTDDEGDEFHHLLTEYGAEDNGSESNKCAYKTEDRVKVHDESAVRVLCCAGSIADCVSCKGKTDDRYGRTDNDGRHEFADPSNTELLNEKSDDYVNKTCKYGTEDQTEVTYGHGHTACKCSSHGTEECERRTKEYGALEFSKEEINDSSDAGTEECCGLGHTVPYDCGNRDGCSKDRKELLKGEYDEFGELRFVVYFVSEFHMFPSFFEIREFSRFRAKKNLADGKIA